MTDKEEIIAKCRSVSRPFLYVMVYICMMNSCDSDTSRLRRIEERLERIDNVITNTPNASLERSARSVDTLRGVVGNSESEVTHEKG